MRSPPHERKPEPPAAGFFARSVRPEEGFEHSLSQFLRDARPSARGWLIEVMKAVESLGRESFTLADAYGLEPRLAALYPANHNVRPKIRQQLQVLRDRGWLEFLGRGRYRVRGAVL